MTGPNDPSPDDLSPEMLDAPAPPRAGGHPAEIAARRFLGGARARLDAALAAPRPVPAHFALLRRMAREREHILRPIVVERIGLDVLSGPFAGMAFLPSVAEGCLLPKLLGCYERELHPTWEALRRERRYDRIVVVGAAEGYYAVGLARLFPEARVLARDTNAGSHAMVRGLASRNGVADRIETGGLFAPADFAAFDGAPTLVVCDIEGGEVDLLDPAAAPALRRCDIVVELHEVFDPSITAKVVDRFTATHDVVVVANTGRDVALPPMFDRMDTLDRMIATWEHRAGPTPWAVMRARGFPA